MLTKKNKIRAYFIITIAIGIVFLASSFVAPPLLVQNARQDIVEIDALEQGAKVAIVFGAGITANNTPSSALMDRLEVAADVYHLGIVRRILVSGDNRTEAYSEPDVMQETLITVFDVPAEDIYADYAGRRTYDTCIRAKELWGIDSAILVSQAFHLPRAIWTCNQLGIQSRGVSASLRTYVFAEKYHFREILASYKAFLDVYLLRPNYIGGDFIQDLDD